MHVDVLVAEVGAAQYGEGVVVRFAQVEHDGFSACERQLQVALEEGYLPRTRFRVVMVVEPELPAGDTLGVLQVFEHACFVFGSLGIDVFRVDSVCGVDVRVFFGELACIFEVCRVACHVDKRLGQLDIRVAVVAQAGEKRVETFSGVALVGIYVAMRVNKHD